jgi:hypothetical protein
METSGVWSLAVTSTSLHLTPIGLPFDNLQGVGELKEKFKVTIRSENMKWRWRLQVFGH